MDLGKLQEAVQKQVEVVRAGSGVSERVAHFREIIRLLFEDQSTPEQRRYAEHVLLDQFEAILALVGEKPELQEHLAEMLGDAIRLNPSCFTPRALPPLKSLLVNSTETVQKKVIVAALGNLWNIFMFFLFSTESTLVLWNTWMEFTFDVCTRMWTAVGPIQRFAVKYVASVICTFASNERNIPGRLSAAEVPQRHAFLRQVDLEDNAKLLLELFSTQFKSPRESMTVSSMATIVALNSLGEISRLCRSLTSICVPILCNVAIAPNQYLSPTITPVEQVSVRISLRSILDSLRKHPRIRQSNLMNQIASATQRVSEQLMGDYRRSGDDAQTRKRPRTDLAETQPRISHAEAVEISEKFKRLPYAQVVELVIQKIVDLPPTCPVPPSAPQTDAKAKVGPTRDPRKKQTGTLRDSRKDQEAQGSARADPRRRNVKEPDPAPAVVDSMEPEPVTVPAAGPGVQDFSQGVPPNLLQNLLANISPGVAPFAIPAELLVGLTPAMAQQLMEAGLAPGMATDIAPSLMAAVGAVGQAAPGGQIGQVQPAPTAAPDPREAPQEGVAPAAVATTNNVGAAYPVATPPVVLPLGAMLPVAMPPVAAPPGAVPPAPTATAIPSRKRSEAPPVEALQVNHSQETRLRKLIANRILRKENEAVESGATELRIRILGRMISSSKPKMLISESEDTEKNLRQLCLDYIRENFAGRIELARQWLYAEASDFLFQAQEKGDAQMDTGEDGGEGVEGEGGESYKELLLVLLKHALEKHSGDDKVISQLLVESPMLPKALMAELKRLSEDPSSSLVGLGLLGDIVLERPGGDRKRALDILLNYAVCPDMLLRGPSIRLLTTKLFELKEAEAEIENFSSSALAKSFDHNKETEGSSEVSQSLHLFLALCAKKPELLTSLAELYAEAQEKDQEAVLGLLEDVAKQIGAESKPVVELVEGSVPKATGMALKILETLATDSQQAQHLLGAAKSRFVSSGDVRFIAPVLSYIDKQTLIELLPALLEKSDEDFLETVIDRTTTGNPPVLLPSEFIYELHVIDADEVAIERALQVCFERKNVFKQEVLATVLQRMVEMTPLPKLFLASVIQTARHQPKLQSFISQSILGRLVEQEIWAREPGMWDGFVHALEETVRRSIPVLLRLPPIELQEAVSASEILREELTRYARESRTALPSSVVSILERR